MHHVSVTFVVWKNNMSISYIIHMFQYNKSFFNYHKSNQDTKITIKDPLQAISSMEREHLYFCILPVYGNSPSRVDLTFGNLAISLGGYDFNTVDITNCASWQCLLFVFHWVENLRTASEMKTRITVTLH